jgi:transcriptional regulator with XRE-family HTH domain/KaiC/GvpD/RAD55 family RecA-like ATPase
MEIRRVSSGVTALDRIIGGLRVGDNVVWHMDSGSFMEVFSAAFLKTSRRQGHRVVLVTVNSSPKTLISRLGGVVNHPDVILVDGFTWGKGEGSGLFAGYYDALYPKYRCRIEAIAEPHRTESFIRVVNQIEEEMPPGTRYLFDSLTGMGQLWGGEGETLTFFTRQCPRLFELDTVAYWILERSAHTPNFRAQINHTTQVAIDLEVREGTPVLTVLKAEGREESSALLPRPFHVRRSRVEFQEQGDAQGDELRIGPSLRALRLKKGLSQVELARTIGVSPSTISQVEGEQILLSLPALVRAARALDASLDSLVCPAAPVGEPHPIGRPEQREPIRLPPFGEEQVVAFALTTWAEGQGLEAYEIRVQPGAHLQGHFFRDKREELGYLLRGEAWVHLGGEGCRMSPGDAIHLRREVPERWSNPLDAEARFLWVLKA